MMPSAGRSPIGACQRVERLGDEVKDAVQESAGHLREPAADAVEAVKARATDAVDAVKAEGASAVDDVRTEAKHMAEGSSAI